MKKNLRYLAGATVGAVVALGFSSCVYDPYYGEPSVGVSYSSGYGDGYGYGGSGFSTSVFVGTGDPRWGYDPYSYSYYDYRSRRYYDPYLYGYYPVGYRPPVVYGVPHPYGWRPGGGYIRPPSRVSDGIIVNYRDRESRYRSSSYGWAQQVRQRPTTTTRKGDDSRSSQRMNDSRSSDIRSKTDSRQSQSGSQNGQQVRESSRPEARSQSNNRLPSGYNTPVSSSQQQARPDPRASQSNKDYRQQAQDKPQKANRTEKQSKEDKKSQRGFR